MSVGEREFEMLRQVRAHQPSRIAEVFAARRRRSAMAAADGKLFIVAADHPARGAFGVGADRMAMASRYELLRRLVLALSRPGVDGVLGTPDIVEDLALLGALEEKVIVGSMNRGGIQGATFEMDDRFTAYDVESLVRNGVDFGKTLLRINLADRGTVKTMEATASRISACAAERVPVMVEPFTSVWRDGRVVNDLSPDAVIRSIAIAAALGASSAYTWLKIPVVDEMARVMEATTLPSLLLGGDPSGHPSETYASWKRALDLPGVRGLVVGRALLYPQDQDVARAVDTAAAMVH